MRMGFGHFSAMAPERIAIIDANGNRVTRRELCELANRLSRALRGAGLKRGDAIAVLCLNSPELLAVHLAAGQIGLYVVPLNWHQCADELAHILESATPCAVVVDAHLAGVLNQALDCAALNPIRISVGTAAQACELRDFVRDFSGTPLEDPTPGRVMYFTSATTGRAKGILAPLPVHPAPWEPRAHLLVSCGVLPESDNVHLSAAMLYHRAPLDLALLALHMGHTVVLVPRPDPEIILAAIQEHAVTTAFMVTPTFVRLLKLPVEVRERYSTQSLRWVNHAGTPCPIEVKSQMMDWWGPVLWEDYGASEAGSLVLCSPQDSRRYPGTVGRPVPGVALKILDDEDHELPPGEAGHIYISVAPADRFEYKGDKEKTQQAYRGEFFTVGDVGYLNKEGYLFLCDRATDMIVTAGTKIYSTEIELALREHPKVSDCAVFAAPDDLLGEVVMAVIQPARAVDADAQLTRELLRFLSDRLSSYKLPRHILYRPELPRNASGKLLKRALREEYSARGRRPALAPSA